VCVVGPRTAWTDNVKTWTGHPVEESIRMTKDRWINGKVRPWCGQAADRGRLKNRTEQNGTVVGSGTNVVIYFGSSFTSSRASQRVRSLRPSSITPTRALSFLPTGILPRNHESIHRRLQVPSRLPSRLYASIIRVPL